MRVAASDFDLYKMCFDFYKSRYNLYTSIGDQIFLDKGLQNPASASMDVHSQLLQTNLGQKSKP
jgi:hypothetical protein